MPRESLGDLEHLVLLALLRLGERSYGVPILEEITSRTGRAVSRPAVYIALRRLEAKGFVKSQLGEATAERGGRAKRYFTLTAPGHRQLHTSREALMSMWANVAHRIRKARP
jgi:PadR family transcriptional regulator, regulatory protein PadR